MRLFIGIELPLKLKQSLLDFQAYLKKLGISGYWKSQENFHITLEFLGELETNRITDLTQSLTEISQKHDPFKLILKGVGAFPSFNRPHTLWTGVAGSLAALNSLQADLHAVLAKHGFVLDNRSFRPHITLASRPSLDNVDLSDAMTKKLGEFCVNEVILFVSSVENGNRIYSDIFRVSLNSGRERWG